MSVFRSSRFARLEPYVPGEQPRERKYVKLNTNESPYPPSPAVTEAARAAAEGANLYCDPTALKLRQAAAAVYGVDPACVLPVNGSDEILNFAVMAFCDGRISMACPEISYGFYPVLADLHGIRLRQVPLRGDLTVDYRDYLSQNCTVFIANPNAPTGTVLGLSEIREIAASNPKNVVVIDEAYVDFGAESAIQLTKEFNNLLVTRTFSKSHSLAGARLGFGIGDAGLIADLTAIKDSTNPYNVNAMTQAAGIAAFGDNGYYMDNCRRVAETRDRAAEALKALGFSVTDSKANFLFVRHPDIAGGALYERLRERGILVRHFAAPAIEDYNRVTVGSPEQMETLIGAVREILAPTGGNDYAKS